ncbi:MAG: hypothetical protein U0804_28095 [Gemmataceae bacterium]
MRVLTGTILVVVAGCAATEPPVTVHPVRGQVLYDGKPAAGVKVYFIPTSAPVVPRIPMNPHGVTGPDGSFELSTFGGNDGAAEGGYQVVLSWPEPAGEGEEQDRTDRLLGWYGPVHSKLTATVAAGANTIPPFKLAAVSRPPGEVQGVPGKN